MALKTVQQRSGMKKATNAHERIFIQNLCAGVAAEWRAIATDQRIGENVTSFFNIFRTFSGNLVEFKDPILLLVSTWTPDEP